MSSSTEVKRVMLGSAPLYTDGWQLSLTSFPSFSRQKAMSKCLSSPSFPMVSSEEEQVPSINKPWHLLAVNQETVVEHIGGLVAECVVLVRVVKQRRSGRFWGSFIRRFMKI